MWDWSSPVAWAVFLAGVGVCVYLVALGIRLLATLPLVESQMNKKR